MSGIRPEVGQTDPGTESPGGASAGPADSRAARRGDAASGTVRYRRILAPLDLTERLHLALQHAGRIAEQDDGTVYLLHVVPAHELHRHRGEHEGREAIEARAQGTARRKLAEIASERLPSGTGFRLLTTVGDPADEILRVAETVRADLIVLSTHGRTGVSHLLLGSVAETVVRRASCPVLTVRRLS